MGSTPRPPTMESEFKLSAPAANLSAEAVIAVLSTIEGVRCTDPLASFHEDLYLDDGLCSLLHQRIGLRLRRFRDGAVLTWKAAVRDEQGLFVSEEHEQSWPKDRAAPTDCRSLPADLRSRTEPFVYSAVLQPIAMLATRRVRIAVVDGQTRAEIAIDWVECSTPDGASGGAAAPRFAELEFELIEGNIARLAEWVRLLREALDLSPLEDNKLQRALDATQSLDAATLHQHSAEKPLPHRLRCLQRSELALRTDPSPHTALDLLEAAEELDFALGTLEQGRLGRGSTAQTYKTARRAQRRGIKSIRKLVRVDALCAWMRLKLDSTVPERLHDSAQEFIEVAVHDWRARRLAKAERALTSASRLDALAELTGAIAAERYASSARILQPKPPAQPVDLAEQRMQRIADAVRNRDIARLHRGLHRLHSLQALYPDALNAVLGTCQPLCDELLTQLDAAEFARDIERRLFRLSHDALDSSRASMLALGAWLSAAEREASDATSSAAALLSKLDAAMFDEARAALCT